MYKRHTLNSKRQIAWKWKDGKWIYHANSNQNRHEVTILILYKREFKTKITRDKVRNYTMIIVSINQDLTVIHIYAPNNRAPKYMKQYRIEGRNRQLGSKSWSLQCPISTVIEQLDINSTRK